MDTCRKTSSKSSSQIKDGDNEPNITILGSLLSKKSWSNSLHRHLPFNNRWKERYFAVENRESLTVISSGKRIDLSIGKITLSNHDYSPDGNYVLAIAYYTGSNSHNAACNNKFDDKPVTCFLTDHVKELEIQLQFPTKSDMLICHGKLLTAMKFQRKTADRLMQKMRANISSFLKKKLHMQSILTNTIDAELHNKELPSRHHEEIIIGHSNSRNLPSSEHLSEKVFGNVNMSHKCGEILHNENLICGNSSSTNEGYGHTLGGGGSELTRGVINRMRSVESEEDIFVERDEDDYSIIENISSETTSRRNDKNKIKNNPMPSPSIESSVKMKSTHDGREGLTSRNTVNEFHSDLLLKGRVDIPLLNNLKPAAGNQSIPTLQLTPDDNKKEREKEKEKRKEKEKEGKQPYNNNNRDLLFDCDVWKEGQLGGLSEIFLRSKMHSTAHQSQLQSPSLQHQSLPSDYSTLNLNLKKVSESSTESASPKLFSTFQEEKQKMKMNSNLIEEDICDDEFRNYRNISGNMGSSSSFFSIPIPKMRILLMSVGTFGDVQPFATLGVY